MHELFDTPSYVTVIFVQIRKIFCVYNVICGFFYLDSIRALISFVEMSSCNPSLLECASQFVSDLVRNSEYSVSCERAHLRPDVYVVFSIVLA